MEVLAIALYCSRVYISSTPKTYQERGANEMFTDADFKNGINQEIANTTDADKIARLEVLREYFTNPEFRAKLEEVTFNNRKA